MRIQHVWAIASVLFACGDVVFAVLCASGRMGRVLVAWPMLSLIVGVAMAAATFALAAATKHEQDASATPYMIAVLAWILVVVINLGMISAIGLVA